jgi:CMP-N-acetylneuraminic acid synthetase
MMQKGIALFDENPLLPVIGVVNAKTHPHWTLKITDEKLVPFIDGVDFAKRSQELPLAYQISGAFYLISPNLLRVTKSFMGSGQVIPLVAESEAEAIDIDTELDFHLAQVLANSQGKI